MYEGLMPGRDRQRPRDLAAISLSPNPQSSFEENLERERPAAPPSMATDRPLRTVCSPSTPDAGTAVKSGVGHRDAPLLPAASWLEAAGAPVGGEDEIEERGAAEEAVVLVRLHVVGRRDAGDDAAVEECICARRQHTTPVRAP